MKQRIFAFDLDGTVLNSAEAIAFSVNEILIQNNLKTLDNELIKSTIGRPINEVFQKSTKNENQISKMVVEFRNHLAEFGSERTSIFPGIIETLVYLKQENCKNAVATNKNTALAEKVVASMEIANYFDFVVGQDITQPKPSPDMLNYIKQISNCEIAAMCGDTVDDVLTAQAANVDSIAIASGSHSHRTLKEANPTYLLNNAKELKALIQKEFFYV